MTDRISGTHRDTASFRDECAFCLESLEAEALGILEPAGHARFQRHLQWCGPCRRELADLQQVVGLLPLLSDVATPSPMVKARLFQDIADDAVASATVNFGNPWAPVQATPTLPASQPIADTTPSWRTWLMSAMVAPLVIALIVLGAWANSLQNDLGSKNGDLATVASSEVTLASNSDIQLYAMQPSDNSPATGHLGGSLDNNVGILVAWNLDPNEKHQVWCQKRNGELLLVSNLEVAQTGEVAQTLNFPEAIGGYSTIYVSTHDGTEEMRVALHEDIPIVDGTPEGNEPAGD